MKATLSVIVLLFILVIPHELGHFVSARAVGANVLRFSVGFGPSVASTWVGGTEYQLAIVPLGGYVLLVDKGIGASLNREKQIEIQTSQPKALANLLDEENYLSRKSPAAQFLVGISGSVINFLIAVLSMPWLFKLADRGWLTLHSFDLLESSGRSFIGPIGLAKMTAEAARRGFPAYWTLVVRFSVGIGLLQLLPIPFLDGSHLLRAVMLASSGENMLIAVFELTLIALIALGAYLLYRKATLDLRSLRSRLTVNRFSPGEAFRELLQRLYLKREL